MRWCPSKRRSSGTPAALAAYYTSAQTDAALAAGLVPYSTTAQMNQAIADALLRYGTVAQRDAAIAAALAAYYTSAQTDAAIAAAIAPYYTSAETDAAIAAAQLSNGQTWNGGPTFNLLRGSNVLRNLSVAGALTASFQNLDDTILIDLHASGNGRSDHRRHRRPGPVPCNSRTRRRSRPSSPRPCRPTWRASWPTTPPAAR